VSEDAGMEPRTVATLTVTLYNRSARSDPPICSPRKDLDLIFCIMGFKDPDPASQMTFSKIAAEFRTK
jgi:hypothetical protein